MGKLDLRVPKNDAKNILYKNHCKKKNQESKWSNSIKLLEENVGEIL